MVVPESTGFPCRRSLGRQEQPLVVPQLEQTKQAPARCMTMPHW